MYGSKHGLGRYKWNDAWEYFGQWADNKMTGVGCCVWKDGRKYEGEWLNNQMHGFGIQNQSDGIRYEGWFKNDKKEGYGQYFWANGRLYSGYWHEGKSHGIGSFQNGTDMGDGKNLQHGVWESGKRVRWLSEGEVHQVNQKLLDVTAFFTNYD